MKVFIKRLEVINWNEISHCLMEFPRENRNFINVFRKNSLESALVQAVLGSEEDANLPNNCVFKLEVLTQDERTHQYSEFVSKYIRIKGIDTVFTSKVSRGSRFSFLVKSDQALFTSRLNLDLQNTLEFRRFSDELTSFEPEEKKRRTETLFDKLESINEEINSSEIAEAELVVHLISSISKIMYYLSDGKASLCFAFSSKENLSQLSNGAMVSYFHLTESNMKVECRFALPEFKLLAKTAVDIARRILIPSKSIPVIELDYLILQQSDILKNIISLIEEMEIPVIFEIPTGQLMSKFSGVNVWEKGF